MEATGDTPTDLTALRSYAFSIAYRMLGSVQEAEDAVQDAYVKILRSPPARVESDRGFLATIVTRTCIDRLRAIARARENYVGPWLPEPLVVQQDPTETQQDPDTLSIAFMVVLESLSPVERAVFLLREVFGYEHAEIAAIVGRSEANVRQIALRSRRAVAARRPRFSIPPERKRQIGAEFVDALRRLDIEKMMSMMTSDVTVQSDGGGKAQAARRPIIGADRVARFLIGISSADFALSPVPINGQPGLVVMLNDEPFAAVSYEVTDDRISDIFIWTNPDKLTSFQGRS